MEQEELQLSLSADKAVSAMLIPFVSPSMISVPIPVARSGVFTAANMVETSSSGVMFNDHLCYKDDTIMVSFTGHLLNQDDADVMAVVNKLISSQRSNSFKLMRIDFLKELGWTLNNHSYARLLDCMTRLSASVFYLESPEENDSFSKKKISLNMFMFKQDGNFLEISIPEQSRPLYRNNGLLDWDKRRMIKSKNGLAKSIQFYMSGFPNQKEFEIELSFLKTNMARAISPDYKFVDVAKKAFAELEAVGVIKPGSSEVFKHQYLRCWYCKWEAS
jgi:uncharacterized protein YdhG (YjbR/CyaY superfamily)